MGRCLVFHRIHEHKGEMSLQDDDSISVLALCYLIYPCWQVLTGYIRSYFKHFKQRSILVPAESDPISRRGLGTRKRWLLMAKFFNKINADFTVFIPSRTYP